MKPKAFRLTNFVLVFALLFSGGSAFAGYQPYKSTSTGASNPNNLAPLDRLENPAMAAAAPEPALPQEKSAHDQARLASSFGQLPLIFIQNQGQMDSRVDYSLLGQDMTIYFSSGGLTFALTAPITDTTASSLSASRLSDKYPKSLKNPPVKTSRWILKLDFIGANSGVTPHGDERAETIVSYFKGSPDQWHTGLPTYHRLVYPDLWPGIDLVYSGSVNRLKYEFVVRPGADPRQIRLAYRGLSALKLDRDGQMEVTTPFGSLQDEAPIAYQVSGRVQKPVSATYKVQDTRRQPMAEDAASAAGNVMVYSFQVSGYDPALPLVIDPAVLVYCGYIGSSGNERGNGISVDESGAAYLTGFTYSDQATFPATGGPDLTFNGDVDAFVAKVRPDGTGLVYAGYLGGSGNDEGEGIAVDGSGAAYVTGYTTSDQTTFPVSVGPDPTYNGNVDAFVAKVRPDGTGLVYAGYLGGYLDDAGTGIAVDGSGTAYVTGFTTSDQATFPATGGPDLTYNGPRDAFVAKVRLDGKGLVYAGYIGGSGDDWGDGIAVDGSGAAYVTGYTNSDQTTFPATGGPDLTYNSNVDAFVAKVRPDGTGLVYAGYLGGSGEDYGASIAVDGSGAAYVIGYTKSDQTTFPVSGGPDLTYNGGDWDAFVAKVRPDGKGLVYAGYIGGSGDELGFGIAVDGGGAAYVTGYTTSDQTTFPVRGGPDPTYNGGDWDAFVAKVHPDGKGLVYCGYLGGSRDDGGEDIAVDGSGAAYVTGWTSSDQATFPVSVGPDLTYNGIYDAFMAEIINVDLYLPIIQR
jgi:hypothetical protein